MNTTGNTAPVAAGTNDAAAVSELIADVEAELRLHLVHTQEFLDGTNDDPPIADADQRERLNGVARAIQLALGVLNDLG